MRIATIGTGCVFLLTWIMTYWFSRNPEWCDELYVEHLYASIRRTIGVLSEVLSFPLIYLSVGMIIMVMVIFCRVIAMSKGALWLRAILSFGIVVAWLLILFQWMWGFNYQRTVPFTMPEDLPSPDSAFLFSEWAHIVSSLDSAAKCSGRGLYEDDKIRDCVLQVLQFYGFEASGPSEVKKLLPKGILYRLETSGFFFPFAGESYIDAAMPEVDIPFVMAHEMSHSYGLGDEGLCNFVAWLVCQRSDDEVRYSGNYHYMYYLLRAIKKGYPAAYELCYQALDSTTKKHIATARMLHEKYPSILPQIRDIIYGTYLRSQGVRSGLNSYDEFLKRVYMYRQSGEV